MRVALGVEYCGTAFHGWQSQPGGETVQDALEKALASICGQPVSVICAGRTDAGVHGTNQVVHFDAPVERPVTAWVRGVNAHLPETVAVRWAQPVSDEFHARFSARGRRYRYLLLNRPQRPGLWQGRLGWFHLPLDLAAMQDAAGRLLGEHDFSAFRAAGCQAKTPVKTMWRADVRQFGNLFVFDFEASAFLHHMVRNLVGSLVYVGKANQSPAWIDALLQARDRTQSAPTFSPDGLYFRGPIYEPHWDLPDPDDDFLDGVFK
ncbi:tRNA pseudouridine(38-40) synthase TruA [Dechloromonas denitrificans]|uniref:tRNA pseudouridine(38-40) synthase TruA n=1 Tax=Dechloromonas denitrificans TaxID=281362 RepID=UPI001CF86713|nr:tRNA pseudouridine(38-40) synthase TruA [Dechloromonas denitrificans]UCV10802.1 tRNA pseudouridine(38-40) synthase TruA [Dechloromonas denitrificans]